MPLTNMIGEVGSGKTLMLTYLCYWSELPVYANYEINIPNFTLLTPEMLVTLNTGSTIGLDEAWAWLEARCSGKEINRYMSYIIFQTRKRLMHVITTDQLLDTIDVRFRLMANYEIECENVDNGFKYRFHKISRYHNYKPRIVFLPYEVAEKYISLYDTYKTIDPIDKNMLFNITQDKEIMLDEIDSYIDKLLKKYSNPNKITKGIVRVHCLEDKLPSAMADLIFNKLKARLLQSTN